MQYLLRGHVRLSETPRTGMGDKHTNLVPFRCASTGMGVSVGIGWRHADVRLLAKDATMRGSRRCMERRHVGHCDLEPAEKRSKQLPHNFMVCPTYDAVQWPDYGLPV
jgi:hypothetical protein